MSLVDRLLAVEESPKGPRIGAFFDFDGTVIEGYSAFALMQERARRLHIGPTELAGLYVVALKGLAGKGSFDALMEVGVKALRGRRREDLQRLGEDIAREMTGGWIFREALDLITAHQRRGHTIAIASSALPFQIEPIARELGIDHVLCTRPGTDGDSYDGTIDGSILWGERKADAVVAFAQEHDVDLQVSFAYANGAEDLDFLATVGHPTAVNAHPDLAKAAVERGWDVEPFRPRRKKIGLVGMGRSVAAYGSLAASMGVGVGLGLLNRDRQMAANTAVGMGSELALGLAGVKLNVVGRPNLWSHRPAVYIFNHQSWLDGFIIMRLVHEDTTGVAKAEVKDQPFFGQFARLMGLAFVDRSAGNAREQLEPAAQKLRDGMSLAISPEGTRSLTPVPGPFKKGAFHLAIQAGVPIVPIVLRNAGELQWRADKFIRAGTVDVEVMEPVDVSDWDATDLDPHIADVRNGMIATLAKWEGGRGVAELERG